MNKKMLKRSLTVLLASIEATVDMNAMQNKKIVTMKDYVKDGKIVIKDVPQYKEANWFVPPKNLKTEGEMLQFLNDYKKDIFYVTMTEGKKARKGLYEKGVKQVLAARKIFRNMVQYANKKRKEKAKGKEYQKIKPALRVPDYKELRENGKTDYFLSIDPSKTAEEQWSLIGRGPGLWAAPPSLLSSDHMKSEINLSRMGYINCTAWATFMNWFLNMNGIPSRILCIKSHECVCVPLRGEYNSDMIRLFTIDVLEDVDSVENLKFDITPLIDKEGVWDFMAWYSPIIGWGASFKETTKHSFAINPTMAYLQLIKEGIRQMDKKHPLEALDGYVKGLQYEMMDLIAYEAQNDDGVICYPVKYLPRDKTGYLIPINIAHIDKAVETGKRMFKVPNSNKTTDLILARFNFTGEDVSNNIMKKHQDRNGLLYITAPQKVNDKRNGLDFLEGLLQLDRSDGEYDSEVLKATVTGLPKNINDVEAEWNYSNFDKQKGIDEIKKYKNKK